MKITKKGCWVTGLVSVNYRGRPIAGWPAPADR